VGEINLNFSIDKLYEIKILFRAKKVIAIPKNLMRKALFSYALPNITLIRKFGNKK